VFFLVHNFKSKLISCTLQKNVCRILDYQASRHRSYFSKLACRKGFTFENATLTQKIFMDKMLSEKLLYEAQDKR
jgi:hypothetical protein